MLELDEESNKLLVHSAVKFWTGRIHFRQKTGGRSLFSLYCTVYVYCTATRTIIATERERGTVLDSSCLHLHEAVYTPPIQAAMPVSAFVSCVTQKSNMLILCGGGGRALSWTIMPKTLFIDSDRRELPLAVYSKELVKHT